MGILDDLEIGKQLADPIKAVGSLYTTDKERLSGEEKLQDTLQKPQMAQLGINAILANSVDFFDSGWQPAIGWAAGFLIILYYAPQIVITTIFWTFESYNSGHVLSFPMRPDDILNLVYLLFGFGVHSLGKKMFSKQSK